MSATPEDLKVMFKEAESRGDRDTAVKIMGMLEQGQGAPQQSAPAPIEAPETQEAPIMAQIGRGMLDVGQGAKQLLINTFGRDDKEDYNKQLSEEVDFYNKNNPNFQFSRLFGALATPLTLIPAAAGPTLGARVAGGVALGAGLGATTPVTKGDFWEEKAKQAAIGGTIGAVIPMAGAGAKQVGKFVDELTKPLYKKGVQRDVSKFLNNYVSENKPMIVKAVSEAAKNGDKRPVGQIIADAASKQGDDFGGMIVRLEKDLSRESDAIKSIYARQSVGRRSIINAIAGTEDDLSSAVQKRATTGNSNYERAFEVDVKADRALVKILDNKFARKSVKDALEIAKADGKTSHARVLHNVKIGLDAQLEQTGENALSRAQKTAVDGVKKRLVNWVENKNPLYKTAREQYALDSKPINKMLVGQEIRNTLITSLEKDSPAKFSEGLRSAHKVLKRATGDSRFKKLDQILSGEEVSQLKGIGKDLAVEARATAMSGASQSIKGQITGEVKVSLPHILSRPVVITNHILGMLGKDMTPAYKKVLIDMIKSPDKFLKIYGGASSNSNTKAALDIIRRVEIIAGSQQSALESGNQ